MKITPVWLDQINRADDANHQRNCSQPDDVLKTSKHHCSDCGVDLTMLSKHIHEDHGDVVWVKCGMCAAKEGRR
jgi:hypothetical protein